MPTATKRKAAPAKKTAAKKAPAAKKTASPQENVAKLIRAAGKAGVTVKALATGTGTSEATVRKVVKGLEDEGKVRRDGPGVVYSTRGRRSADVANRDAQVLAAIRKAGKEGLTKAQIQEAVDTTAQLAYESIWRLRAQGEIKREGSTRNATWAMAK